MKIEYIILAITIFLVANTYYDGKLLDTIKSWKKYYQIGFFIIFGIGLYLFIKNNPKNGQELFASASQVIKTLPIDKNSKDLLTPILNLSNQNTLLSNSNISNNYSNNSHLKRMLNSGNQTTKRSVSETKKKICSITTRLEM